MKRLAFLLCVVMSLTGCHWTQVYDWKQSYDQKKFEAMMTTKAKLFVEWYYEGARKAIEEGDEGIDLDQFDLNFVRLGVEDKKYVVFNAVEYDDDGNVEYYSYAAIDLSKWDSSVPFSPDAPPEDITIFGDLTRTADGMGFVCEEDCYFEGPNADIDRNLIFEEAAPSSKDLEKLAAFRESLKLNRASKAISSLYGLSEERSFQLSKTLFSWKKVSNQRAMTKRDLDHLTIEFAGVKASEIVESFKELAEGDESRFNNLIDKAAEVNDISPEAVKSMIQDAFMR